MDVVQSQVDVQMMTILIAGVVGYVPILLAYGLGGLHHLFVLYAGLGLGTLATTGKLAYSTVFTSETIAVIVLGTSMLFVMLAYQGNRKINNLLQRVQRDGAVIIGD